MSISDVLNILANPGTLAGFGTIVGVILGYLGGIPQIVRWLGKHPVLKVQNLSLSSKATDIMQSSIGESGKLTGVSYYLDFNIQNLRKRWRVLKSLHATGLGFSVTICEKDTNQEINSFGEKAHMTVLPPGSKHHVLYEVPKALDSKDYRIYVYAYCDEGISTYADETVRVVTT